MGRFGAIGGVAPMMRGKAEKISRARVVFARDFVTLSYGFHS
jgi:hypothetical protein